MNRRELLHAAGAAACVAVVPEFLDLPLFGQWGPKPTWKETAASAAALSRMKPLLEKYDKKLAVRSLSADEWDEFANAHEIYINEHAKNGDMHRVDVAIKANEVYFRKKLNHDELNYLIEHGAHAVIAQVPAGFHQGAEKLRREPYQPASFASCDGAWSTFSMWAIVMGVLFPEFEPLFIILGLYYWAMGGFMCTA